MTTLLGQLPETLSDHYGIKRELGRGQAPWIASRTGVETSGTSQSP